MTSDLTIVIPDTNVILHAKELAQLDWRVIAPTGDVIVGLVSPVLRELDAHKGDKNSRRARRARDMVRTVRDLLGSPDRSKQIQPNTKLALLPHMPIRRLSWPSDFLTMDERIVLTALAWAKRRRDARVTLLTNDVNMQLLAEHHRLPSTLLPQTWLRDDEPSEEEKQIADLRRELSRATSQRAILVPEFVVGGRKATRLELEIETFEHLPVERADELIRFVISKNPPLQPDAPTVEALAQATDREFAMEQYRSYRLEYELYEGKVREFFIHLPRELERSSRERLVEMELRNDGALAATGLTLELIASGGLLLRIPRRIPAVRLPTPPTFGHIKPHMWAHRAAAARSSSATPRPAASVRERLAVRFNPEPGDEDTRWSLECEEFRESYRLLTHIVIPYRLDAGDLRVMCEARAAPPAKGKKTALTISIRYRTGALEPILERLLEPISREG